MSKQHDIPTTLAVPADLTTLRVEGSDAPLADDERRALLAAVRMGEIVNLTIDAEVYRQSKTPRPLPMANESEANANATVFRERGLKTFARSFKGRPFLRDHDRHDLFAVGGEIAKSDLSEEDGWYVLRQTFRIVKPWAVEAALDGTLRTFSIGWDAKKRDWMASLHCTVCNVPILSAKCDHWLGDEAELDNGDRVLVEAEWRDVTGAETSAVSFPAVQGTTVESIRAALAELRADAQPINREADMAEKKTADEVKAQLEELKSQLAASEEALAFERAAREREQQEQIAALREQALADGLFVPNSALDESFAVVAKSSLALAQKWLGELKPRVPVGTAMQSGSAPAEPSSTPSEFDKWADAQPGMSEFMKEQLRANLQKLGETEESFVAHAKSQEVN